MKCHTHNSLARCLVQTHPANISVIPYGALHSIGLYVRACFLMVQEEEGTFAGSFGGNNKGVGKALRT